MSAICSDLAHNLGNVCEHVFSLSCCALAEHHDHLTNCVVKDIPRVMIQLWFPKVSKVRMQVFIQERLFRGKG